MNSSKTFKDKPWNQRFLKLGDEAEGVFENWAARHNIGFHRSGLNRPPFDMNKLSKMVCYTPDYLTADGYIECQGYGKDQLIKLKDDKLDALQGWNLIQATSMFLWDNVRKRVCQVPISWFGTTPAITTGIYPEGKKYQVWLPEQLPQGCWESFGAN
jgi:hypothetical protein